MSHPLVGRPELLEPVQREQVRGVLVQELDGLFQPPLLPDGRSVQDPRVPPVLRAHHRVHAEPLCARLWPAAFPPARPGADGEMRSAQWGRGDSDGTQVTLVYSHASGKDLQNKTLTAF